MKNIIVNNEEFKDVWVVGAGKYGIKAGLWIKNKYPNINLKIIDIKEEITNQNLKVNFIHTNDVVSFLDKKIGENSVLIIPCIPIHLAFEFILKILNPNYEKANIFDEINKKYPNEIFSNKDTIYTSIADFICPEDCPAPANYCFKTGKKREYNLYDYIESKEDKFEAFVIKSYQIFPGVGGYSSRQLLDCLENIKKSNKNKFLISTACRCHGVINFLKKV